MKEQQNHLWASHEAQFLQKISITLAILLNKRRPGTESLSWGYFAAIGSQPRCIRLVPSTAELFLWAYLYSSKPEVGRKLAAKVGEQSEVLCLSSFPLAM